MKLSEVPLFQSASGLAVTRAEAAASPATERLVERSEVEWPLVVLLRRKASEEITREVEAFAERSGRAMPETDRRLLARSVLRRVVRGYAEEQSNLGEQLWSMETERAYAAALENAIFGCPGVADAAVIGVPDERWGEAVKAIVVPVPGERPDPEAVIAWARQRIAGYKAPKSVDFIDILPRNASGKVLRRELRKPYWEGRGRLVG